MAIIFKMRREKNFIIYALSRTRLLVLLALFVLYSVVLVTINLPPYLLLLISVPWLIVLAELIIFGWRRANASSQRVVFAPGGTTEIWIEPLQFK